MERFYIEYCGYASIEANSAEEAEEKLLAAIPLSEDKHVLDFTVYLTRCENEKS